LRDGIHEEANQWLSDTPVTDWKNCPTNGCLMNANNSVIVGRKIKAYNSVVVGRKMNAIWRE